MTDTTSPQTARYRHRISEVEAVQWTGSNADQLRAFCGPDFDEIDLDDRTEDPDQTAAVREADHGTWRGLAPGDWVVKLDEGLYEFSAADFAKQYEAAAPSAPADRAGRSERYAAAIRDTAGWVLDDGQHMIAAVMAVADAEQVELRRERDLAIAHDRQPYPTAWAYEQACKALRTHRERADELEQEVRRLRLMVDEYGAGASSLTDKLKRARDMHRETCPLARGAVPPTAFRCGMCEVLDAPAVLPPAADRAAVCICGHCEVVATEAQQQPGGTAFSPGEGVHGRDPYYASSDTEEQQAETQAPDADPVYDPRAWETYRRDAGCGCTAPAPVDCKIPHGTGAWLCTCHRLAGPPLRDGDPRGTFLTSEEEAIRRHFQEPNRCLSTDGIFRCSRPTGHLGDHRTGRTFWGRRAEDTTPPAVVAEPGKETRPAIPCSWAATRYQHSPHDWNPQPGMDPVRCPGWSDGDPS